MPPNGSTEPAAGAGAGQPKPAVAQAARAGELQKNIRLKMLNLADRLIALLDEIPRAGLVKTMLLEPPVGAPDRRCPHCGNIVPAAARFCGTCGKPFDAAVGQMHPAQPAGTRGSPAKNMLNQCMQTYLSLAARFWDASAAGQVEAFANNEYSAAVEALEKRLTFIEEACKGARQNPKARGGWFWRQRVGLYKRALLEWKGCLGESQGTMFADLTRCGRVLYRAHGRVGLASLSGYDYLLVKSLQGLALVGTLWPLSVIFLEIYFTLHGGSTDSFSTILILLGITTFTALYVFWLSGRELSLPAMIGYILAKRQPDAAQQSQAAPHSLGKHSRLLRGVLLFWLRVSGLFPTIILLPGILIVLLVFIGLLSQGFGTALTTALLILFLLIPFYLAVLIIVSLPFTVTVQVQMARELTAHPTRPPEARRYAVRPALRVFTSHSLILVLLTWAIFSWFGILDGSLSLFSVPVSYRLIIYLALPLLLYGLSIEWPYRQGLGRWKDSKLGELTALRKKIEQRLDPAQTGVYAPGHTVQEDYARWQYYRAQESEVNDISPWSFSVKRGGAFSVALLIGGFLIDHLDLIKQAADTAQKAAAHH